MKSRGFTLFELVLVIVITGILATVIAPIINEPIRAYFDQAGRNALVDAAEISMRRMERDVRRALPYSLRVHGSGDAIEFVRVRDAARYRENGGGGQQKLRFNNSDDQFNVLGTFPSVTAPYTLGTDHADERLVIMNLGSSPYSIYDGDPVVTPGGTAVAITVVGNEHHVTMTPAHQFQASSPSHRVFITETSVSYGCLGGNLYYYPGYGYQVAQRTPAQVATNGAVMTDKVTDCTFTYHPGSATQTGLLIMELTLTNDAGESVTLQHMIHVPNSI